MDLIDRFLPSVDDILDPSLSFITTNKRISYLNAPIAFDIETTSFYQKGDSGIPSLTDDGKGYEKKAIMYAFVLGINGRCILGRTWDDFLIALRKIADFYGLSIERRAIIYVHNLDFEFQFIKDLLHWEKVFATSERKPLFALTTDGIEFRDSYKLSGYSLAYVGEHLHHYKVKKMVGDLDYSLFRHSQTPLTEKEKGYILNDGLVVMAYIKEEMEAHQDNITKLPLTKTGEVRKLCRRYCYPYKDLGASIDYRDLMLHCQIKSLEEYQEMKRGFQGGFTHAGNMRSFATLKDVHSFDFTSSYPAVMVMEKFPIGTGTLVHPQTKEEFKEYLRYYCCLFDCDIYGLEDRFFFEHYLSASKCSAKEGYQLDNGRVIKAKHLTTTLTEVDYAIMARCYTWKRMRIANFRIYPKGYLPLSLVKAILSLYKKKTELKGVAGQEVEYMHSKEQLNSCYGMTVTDIVQDDITYKDGQWENVGKDSDKTIERYNITRNRFLFYPWGIWVTAYARRNLWNGGIFHLEWDYVYSDTDSVKFVDFEKNKDIFRKYNRMILRKIKKVCSDRNLPMESFAPKTKEGKTKVIGFWDYEGKYDLFKTLGAKRYMTMRDGVLASTISGINKKVFDPWISEEARKQGKTPFDLFDDTLFVPAEHTGKNTHTYIDDPHEGVIRDYLGNDGYYKEMSAVHLEKASYDFSPIARINDFILGAHDIKY